jgi:hypothetical protein
MESLVGGRKQNLKVGKFNPPLSASYFKEDTESLPLIEVSIPKNRRLNLN